MRTRDTDPLRIAVVAPPWYEVPPNDYGGIELVVAHLVDGLVDRGHDVTLIASGDNKTRASKFLSVYATPPSQRIGEPIPEVVQAAGADRLLNGLDVDVIHDHSLAGPLAACGRDAPTVVTMHGPVDGELGTYYGLMGDTIGAVGISRAQRAARPELNWLDVVHNAVDVKSFPFRPNKEDFVLWLGRFSPEKGASLAIDAARAAGRRIVLAGKKSEAQEVDYFNKRIKPRLGPDASFIGVVDAQEKRTLLAAASALLCPIQWEEPFGLVMAEALSCGTPVVALGRGSVREIVEHGKSGIIVDDALDLPAALDAAGDLDPANCRQRALDHFDLPLMVDRYLDVFRRVVETPRRCATRLSTPGGHQL